MPTVLKKRHLGGWDTLATATRGPRGRPLRALLSGIGVAIGIASLVAVLGIPASYQAQAEAEFNAWGANLLVAAPVTDRMTGEVIPFPATAPPMVDRIWSVKASLTLRQVPEVSVYRSDKTPEAESRGLVPLIATGDPVDTLSTPMLAGRWFDTASAQLPTVVLGHNAAVLLAADVGQRIWLGGSWWAVIGILGEFPGFAGHLNSAAFLAPEWAERTWTDLPISQILINTQPGKAAAVMSVLAATVNPGNPRAVDISKPSQYGAVQDYFFDMFSQRNDVWGVGIKYSYDSPIGPLSVQISRSNASRGINIYFSLGKSF